jgi:hypothetical protein
MDSMVSLKIGKFSQIYLLLKTYKFFVTSENVQEEYTLLNPHSYSSYYSKVKNIQF